MPDSLPELENRRSQLINQIAGLGDFRPGSISATRGRCGNPHCHCHQKDDSGHGPNLRLTFKVDGKTVTETFSTVAAQRKAEREIAGFRRYQELSRELVNTSEKICRQRLVEDTLTAEEKKRPKRSRPRSRAK